MTVSHLTRTRDQLWSDLLVALGGSEAFLTRSLSERKTLLEILETYGSSVSLLNIDDVAALLAAVVNAAGGTASHLRQNKHEMLAALVTALGGTAPSASSSSIGELLAACVNAADTGGGGGDEPEEWAFADFTTGTYRVAGAAAVVSDVVVEDAGADWGAFNPATAITEAGLTGNPVIAAGLEATLLASGFTVIGTYTPGAGDNGNVQIDAYDSPEYTVEWLGTAAFDKAGGDVGSQSHIQAAASQVNFAAEDGTGPVKFALSIAPGFVSMSINGGSVHTDTTIVEAIYNNIGIHATGCRLETLTFHPLQEDANLPALAT